MADDKKNQDLVNAITAAVAQGVAAAIPQVLAQLQSNAVQGPQAAAALPAPVVQQPLDLRGRIRVALMRESLDLRKLSRSIGESIDTVAAEVKALHAEHKLVNVGFEESPIWCWRVGNDADTQTLIRAIQRLIAERPMKLREIVWATGAKDTRVSGALVEIQRRKKVVDMSGGGHTKIYFLIESSQSPELWGGGGKVTTDVQDDPETKYMMPMNIEDKSLEPRPTTRAAREMATGKARPRPSQHPKRQK